MRRPKNFVFTTHATKRSGERVITQELFIEVVTGYSRRKQQYRGTHGGWVYLFMKNVEGKQLHIAAEIHKDTCYFVTGFWT